MELCGRHQRKASADWGRKNQPHPRPHAPVDAGSNFGSISADAAGRDITCEGEMIGKYPAYDWPARHGEIPYPPDWSGTPGLWDDVGCSWKQELSSWPKPGPNLDGWRTLMPAGPLTQMRRPGIRQFGCLTSTRTLSSTCLPSSPWRRWFAPAQLVRCCGVSATRITYGSQSANCIGLSFTGCAHVYF